MIMTTTSAPPNHYFIGLTGTTKLTNSMALSAGYTLLFTFSTPVSGTFLFDAQPRLEWVVGQVTWNSVSLGISTDINY